MTQLISRYDKIMETVFDQINTEHEFDLEKDLPLLVKQYELLIKPAFLYVLNMRDPENRLVFEKNYCLKSDKGEVSFETILGSVPAEQFEMLMEIDNISAQFINELFDEPFQYLMNVSIPVELIKGKKEYFLRTATVMSFAKDGKPDYAIAYFKNITKITGVTNSLKYYISTNSGRTKKIEALSKAFNKLLEAKMIITSQEKKVLNLVKKGLTSQSIASELFITKSTVDTHRQNIIKKLEVVNMRGAIEKAVDISVM